MKAAIDNVITLTAIILMSLIPLTAGIGSDSDIEHISYTITIDSSDLTFRRVNDTAVPVMPEGEYMYDPGKPMLPVVPVTIALPPGYELLSVDLIALGEEVIPGSYHIHPSQKPLPMSRMNTAGSRDREDPAVYQSPDPYPEDRVISFSTGCRYGIPIAEVLIYPLQYYPLSGEISLLTSFDLELSIGKGGSGCRSPGVKSRIRHDESVGVIEKMVVNPGDVAPYIAGIITVDYFDSDIVEELIITSSSYVSAFQVLADWKSRKGIPTAVITTSDIYSSYSGSDNQEKIRNCIIDYFENNGLVWVLLGGDTDVVPYRNGYVPISGLSEAEKNVPSDLYYSDLDGDWNADGDSKWGEYPDDDVDMYSDVYIARAPVNTMSEVQNFISKILTYEASGWSESLPLDYQLDICFVGEQMWPGHYGGDAKDIIDDRYVPERFDPITKLYERDGTLSKTALRNALNAGRNLVNNDTHGWTSGMSIGGSSWTTSDMDALTNGSRLGLWYSTSCYVGNISSNCVAEHWVNTESGGGFAFVGNSHYGWGSAGNPGYGPSDKFDNQFFNVLMVYGYTNAGKAHGEAKNNKVVVSRSDKYMRYCLYELNLLGDPETPVWTDSPGELSVGHTLITPPGNRLLTVRVTDDSGPVRNAVVCLWKEGEVYEVEKTGMNGEATVQVHPLTEGDITVTVTAENFIPHVSSISVQSGNPRGYRTTDH